jgi:hypothetical protein
VPGPQALHAACRKAGFDQRFDTRGTAPARLALAPFTTIHAGAELQLTHGLFLDLQISGETYFLRMSDRAGDEQLRVGFAVRPSLGFGKQF